MAASTETFLGTYIRNPATGAAAAAAAGEAAAAGAAAAAAAALFLLPTSVMNIICCNYAHFANMGSIKVFLFLYNWISDTINNYYSTEHSF